MSRIEVSARSPIRSLALPATMAAAIVAAGCAVAEQGSPVPRAAASCEIDGKERPALLARVVALDTVLFANRAYASLKHELFNVGARNPGRKALDMLEIGRPDLDWVSLARGMGVEAARATSNAEFIRALRAGLASEGPYLIEAVI